MEDSFEGLDETNADRVKRTFAALAARGVAPFFARTRQLALSKVLEMIPKGASVAHGSSTTLEQIGFIERLDDPASGYRYLNAEWRDESDPIKRNLLRGRLSVEADFFLGSVQALAETGEAIAADAGGSRQAFYVYGPSRVIWVAGINKLVPTAADGLRRVREIALPLEDQRMKTAGAKGSYVGKLVIYERERPGRISLILVGEPLGF
jgi:LUD domain